MEKDFYLKIRFSSLFSPAQQPARPSIPSFPLLPVFLGFGPLPGGPLRACLCSTLRVALHRGLLCSGLLRGLAPPRRPATAAARLGFARRTRRPPPSPSHCTPGPTPSDARSKRPHASLLPLAASRPHSSVPLFPFSLTALPVPHVSTAPASSSFPFFPDAFLPSSPPMAHHGWQAAVSPRLQGKPQSRDSISPRAVLPSTPCPAAYKAPAAPLPSAPSSVRRSSRHRRP